MNAKNESWGGNITDARGQDIYDWTTQMGYRIENDRHDPPTFYSNRGIGWIDLQLTKKLKVVRRKVSEEETLSDHRNIELEIEQKTTKENKGRRYNVRKANWEQLKEELTKWQGVINEEMNIEEKCKNTDQFIKECCWKTIPRFKNKKKKQIENIWWNEDLEKLKRKVNKTREAMQEERDNEERTRKRNAYITK